MRPTVIYVPELKKTFATISAAARATKTDASNVGKVLRGQRKTAGGLHFEYRWAKEEGRSEALAALRASLKEANKLLQTAKERRRFGFSKELQELDKLRDVLGSTKGGRFKTSAQTYTTYSVGEIEQITGKIEQRLYHARKALKKLDDEIRDLADMLGLSFQEALRYEILVPEFYRMLELADKDQRVGTNEMLEIEIHITNAGATQEQVAKLFDKLNKFFADPALPREYFDSAVRKTIENIRKNDDYSGYFEDMGIDFDYEDEDEDTWNGWY